MSNTRIQVIRVEETTGKLESEHLSVCDKHLSVVGTIERVVSITEDPCYLCDHEWYERYHTCRNKQTWLRRLKETDIVYVSGQMTGLKDYNRPAFWLMEHVLKSSGCRILSPAHYEEEHPYTWYMKEAIKMLLEATHMVRLSGWKNSNGACFETEVAQMIGVQILDEIV